MEMDICVRMGLEKGKIASNCFVFIYLFACFKISYIVFVAAAAALAFQHFISTEVSLLSLSHAFHRYLNPPPSLCFKIDFIVFSIVDSFLLVGTASPGMCLGPGADYTFSVPQGQDQMEEFDYPAVEDQLFSWIQNREKRVEEI